MVHTEVSWAKIFAVAVPSILLNGKCTRFCSCYALRKRAVRTQGAVSSSSSRVRIDLSFRLQLPQT